MIFVHVVALSVLAPEMVLADVTTLLAFTEVGMSVICVDVPAAFDIVG